jgi:hypothetical protein
MKDFILSGFVGLIVATTACSANCQISSATETAARELVEVMLREGSGQAAAELAELGGEAAVREVLERAASEGGEALVERVAQYGTRYGPAALKAVERSPSRMLRALDGMPPDLVQPAIRAAAREPELTSRLVATYGKDGFEVAAKHPGVGASLVEKLGTDGIAVGRNLTTDQAVALARYADEIAALPPEERNQLLDAMTKAPAAVLDFLETHPKVLLTVGGVAAVIAAKDNVFGGTGVSTNHGAMAHGLIERVIFGVVRKLAGPMKVIFVIVAGGIFCYLAIHLRLLWKMKAVRLRMEESQALAEIARPSNAAIDDNCRRRSPR